MAGKKKKQLIPLRAPFFMATEGSDDASFARWIWQLCEEQALHFHFDIQPLTGGDPLGLVETAVKLRNRRNGNTKVTKYVSSFLLLDTDCWDISPERRARATRHAHDNDLNLVFQRPNLEGVLLRMHAGHENDAPPANRTHAALRRVWPDYPKGKLIARDLNERFSLNALKSALRNDPTLNGLIALLDL